MELKILYLILAGWALMLFFPSSLAALVTAIACSAGAVYIVFLEQGAGAELYSLSIRLVPVISIIIFAAWPIGALFRRMLRRRRSS